jgi:hypothetical protein
MLAFHTGSAADLEKGTRSKFNFIEKSNTKHAPKVRITKADQA